MNDMAERHCGHIKAVHLRYQWWCHQKALSRGATVTLRMDYVARYQVHTVRDTTQEQPHSALESLGLDMILELESFVDHRWSLEVTKYQVIRPWLEEGLPCVRAGTRQASTTFMRLFCWFCFVLLCCVREYNVYILDFGSGCVRRFECLDPGWSGSEWLVLKWSAHFTRKIGLVRS
jgi:hypothetical protein